MTILNIVMLKYVYKFNFLLYNVKSVLENIIVCRSQGQIYFNKTIRATTVIIITIYDPASLPAIGCNNFSPTREHKQNFIFLFYFVKLDLYEILIQK